MPALLKPMAMRKFQKIYNRQLFLKIYYVSMKKITLLGIGCLTFVGLITGCDKKPAPIKEGVIWKVVWSEESDGQPSGQTALFRAKTLPNNIGEGGVDMYGKLYQDFIEIQRVGSSHSQIIPLREILELEFGE